VFIMLGQSNMVGHDKVTGPDGSLEFAVKTKKKYPHLINTTANWIERSDVRFVRVMVGSSGMQLFNNEFLKVNGVTMGPEYGIGHPLGDAIAAPMMLLKSCIGNRSPGSERYVFNGKVYAGYTDRPNSWPVEAAMGTVHPSRLGRQGRQSH
jgi:alpha-galactosidase